MSIPHWAQTAGCISRWPPPNPPPPPPYPPPWFRRADRQAGQRLGSLVNPLELKNSCSPAVKVNTAPQSLQVRSLSEIAIRMASNSVVLVQSRSSDVAETLTCTCADSTRYVQATIGLKNHFPKARLCLMVPGGEHFRRPNPKYGPKNYVDIRIYNSAIMSHGQGASCRA